MRKWKKKSKKIKQKNVAKKKLKKEESGEEREKEWERGENKKDKNCLEKTIKKHKEKIYVKHTLKLLKRKEDH